MAEQYIKKIRTEAGDLQIDYESLANKPEFDADWKAANNLADATVVNNKIKGVEDKVNAANTEIDQLAAAIESLGGDLGDIGSQGYITEAELQSKGYVTETKLAEKGYVTSTYLISQGYVTETELESQDYVTEEELAAKRYLTALPVATTSIAGIVKPSDSNFYIDSSGYLRTYGYGLESLVNVQVVSSLPTYPSNNTWYLVPAGEW